MNLQCYALTSNPPPIVPGVPLREWMDKFPSHHAYRCLPLSIANCHGWQILSPHCFEIQWTGGPSADDITVRPLDGHGPLKEWVCSHFSQGIVTFHTGYLFRTEPGWDLLATGPFNSPKDGIAPLTGVVEADWLPYPFTMNWQLTRPGTVRWERGEPFCFFFPVLHRTIEQTVPEIRSLDDATDLRTEYETWRRQREKFMEQFRGGDAATLKEAWQRFYFRGMLATGGAGTQTHSSKLRPPSPVDLRRKSP